MFCKALLFIATIIVSGQVASALCLANDLPQDGFNQYILDAVKKLNKEHSKKGYNIKKSYTHDMEYAGGTIRASSTKETMCVAAVAEVIITALNLYSDAEKQKGAFSFLPIESWTKFRPKDLRSHIWVDHHLDSFGTADALVTFGIGKRVKFSELAPGSFINLNRDRHDRPGKPDEKPSGHAVIFLSYVDEKGGDLSSYSERVKGFRYFSAQGSGAGAGLGYRVAFFRTQNYFCPTVSVGIKTDCGVIFSRSQKMLNAGYMLHPTKWNAATRDENLGEIARGLYAQTRSRGPEFLGFPATISEADFYKALDEKDTMTLNPIFENANDTD